MDTLLPAGLLTELTSNFEVQEKYKDFVGFLTSSEMISTIIFLLFSFFLYYLFSRNLKQEEKNENKKEKNKEDQDSEAEIDKFKVKRIFLRNTLILFLFVGLFFIWKDEIKTTLISISFAIMAIVVLFKEILLNILSSFVISFTKPYKIGDIIDYKGKIGTVIDRTILNTKILVKKDGLNTGNEFIIPNFHFVTTEIVVLTRLGNYTTHYIDVNVTKREHLLVASRLLKEVADQVTLIEKGRGDKMNKWKKKLKEQENMDIPSHRPFVIIHPDDKPYITLKYTCHYRSAYLLRQEILERYLEKFPLEVAKYEKGLESQIKKQDIKIIT